MEITLKSGRVLQKRKADEENEMTKKKEETRKESELNSLDQIEEGRKSMVQQEQPVE